MQDELLIHRDNGGVLIQATSSSNMTSQQQALLQHVARLDITQLTVCIEDKTAFNLRLRLHDNVQASHLQDYDSLSLCTSFGIQPHTNTADLEKEIIISMLSGPLTFEYPSYAEFAAAVRIRINIVEAARRTALAFHTSKIERPGDYWTYSEDTGFTVLPGKPLIEALRKATQPEASGMRYAFSCYRATEYVILLAIAEEAARSNPPLLQQLQQQWEERAIMSRQFHEVFLDEFGSMNEPLPARYYIPGDRLWFRNPDAHSADIDGYEGSWVFYLGNGLFSNFWESEQPFTFDSKCLEIYHWRHGASMDETGTLHMDESIVKDRVSASLNDAEEFKHILEKMQRLRDPQGMYAEGGCIDASRECPRYICHGTSTISLPLA
jgi:Protein-glutamine gamma-glutamyltransferase